MEEGAALEGGVSSIRLLIHSSIQPSIGSEQAQAWPGVFVPHECGTPNDAKACDSCMAHSEFGVPRLRGTLAGNGLFIFKVMPVFVLATE